MSIEFQNTDGLGGNRKDLAKDIIKHIKTNGPTTTPTLVEELYGGFDYTSKQSLQRTLSDLRKVLEDRGQVSCERVDSAGSRMTWKWFLPSNPDTEGDP